VVQRAASASPVKADKSPAAVDPRTPGPTAALQSSLGNATMGSLLIRQRLPSHALQPACCESCADGGPCDSEEERRAMRNAIDARAVTVNRPQTLGSGEALDDRVRPDMESAFGSNFESVRVHRDASAQRAAADVNATAFTVGRDIYFGAGRYAPHSADGRRLIAHELTHTLQQRGGASNAATSSLTVSEPGDACEREADAIADHIVGGGRSLSLVTPDRPQAVARAYGLTNVSRVIQRKAEATGASATTEQSGTRADLLARVAEAQAQVQRAGPNLAVDAATLASLNAQVSTLNATAAIGAEPMTEPLAEPLGAFLARLGAWLAIAVDWEIVAIAILVIALVAFIAWLFSDESGKFAPPVIPVPQPQPEPAPIPEPQPAPQPEPEPAPQPQPQPAPEPAPQPEPEPEPQPEPKPKPKPKPKPWPPVDVDPNQRRRCRPTGLTKAPDDAIPMTWFKPRIDFFYPPRIMIQGDPQPFLRDAGPRALPIGQPHGEPEKLGVKPKYWPSPEKTFQLFPFADQERPEARRFRDVLKRYGFDWRGLQADHVQDLEFDGPDAFENLWPLSEDANRSAGAATNNQSITFCLTDKDPSPITGRFSVLKKTVPSIYGRFFKIAKIEVGPSSANHP
jgi:hypothetical protein